MSGVRLDVRSDIERMIRAFGAETKQLETAIPRALNRAQDTAATETSRQIRKRYNLRDRAVKKALTKVRASKGRLFAVLRIESGRIPLIEFDGRWRRGQRGGATVRVLVAGGRKVVPGAFIATMPGGHVGIFRRSGKFGRRGDRRLERIKQLYSVSVPQAFSQRIVLDQVSRLSEAAFVKNLEQQLTYLGGRDGG